MIFNKYIYIIIICSRIFDSIDSFLKMDEDQIITVTCLYPPPYPAPYRASSASSANSASSNHTTTRYFLNRVWKPFRLPEFQRCVTPETARYCCSIEGIFEVPDVPGSTTAILYKPVSIARDGVYPFPCMSSSHYNDILPTILKLFGEQWWSCNSHEDLRHFKTSNSYNEIYYAAMERNDVRNTAIQYDNMVSPCQQLVMSTLLCSQEFSVRLPLRLILNILTFLPQVLFRGGDVVNCCPIENDVDDIHNFNNLNNL